MRPRDRGETVRAEHDVGVEDCPVAQFDVDALALGSQVRHARPEAKGIFRELTGERFDEACPVHDEHAGAGLLLDVVRVERGQAATSDVADGSAWWSDVQRLEHRAGGGQLEALDGTHGIGPQRDARTDLAQRGSAFDDSDVDVAAREASGEGETADASSDDDDVHDVNVGDSERMPNRVLAARKCSFVLKFSASARREEAARSHFVERASRVDSRRMADADPTQVRKRPRQARSVAMVEAMLDACEELLASTGYERLSTRDVAARAGVSVGSLYQYFPAKPALVGAVIERKLERDFAALWARCEASRGRGAAACVDVVVRALVELFARQSALYTEMVAAMAEVAREVDVRTTIDAAAERMAILLRDEGAMVEERKHAVFLVSTALVATLRETARQAPERLTDPEFADELVHLVTGFLEPPRRGPARRA